MLRKLYHGSRDIIKKPVYGYGKKYNDYGLGFYCTEDINMAAVISILHRLWTRR